MRLRPLWCCGCSVVSRSQEAMNQNRGRHRVMPIAGGTENPQQRTHVRVHLWWSVRRSQPAHIIFGVVEMAHGPRIGLAGGESRYTRWPAQRSSAVHTALHVLVYAANGWGNECLVLMSSVLSMLCSVSRSLPAQAQLVNRMSPLLLLATAIILVLSSAPCQTSRR